MNHAAIYKLYPNVVMIDNEIAYDKDHNEVQYDLQAVKDKAQEMQAAAIAKEEAEIAARISAQEKLAALGLNFDEIKAIIGVK
jgi:hypothetical protein